MKLFWGHPVQILIVQIIVFVEIKYTPHSLSLGDWNSGITPKINAQFQTGVNFKYKITFSELDTLFRKLTILNYHQLLFYFVCLIMSWYHMESVSLVTKLKKSHLPFKILVLQKLVDETLLSALKLLFKITAMALLEPSWAKNCL